MLVSLKEKHSIYSHMAESFVPVSGPGLKSTAIEEGCGGTTGKEKFGGANHDSAKPLVRPTLSTRQPTSPSAEWLPSEPLGWLCVHLSCLKSVAGVLWVL